MDKIAIIFQGNIRTDARILREINSFTERGVKVDVFSSNVDNEDYTHIPKDAQILSFKSNYSWLNRNIFFSKQFTSLIPLIYQGKYDAVICDNYPFLEIGLAVKKMQPNLIVIYDSREIYIATFNQFFPLKGWRSIYGYPLFWLNTIIHSYKERKQVALADLCITVCQSLATYFDTKYNVRFEVVRNLPKLSHMKEQELTIDISWPFEESDFVLLYQGNINPGRGLEEIINCMAFMPTNVKLLILGDGMLLPQLKNLVRSRNLSTVQFMNRVDYNQLLAYTQKADLGVSLIEPINVSKRLSLPNKLFEYMSVGTPFISNDLPEPKYLVDEYECGVVVNMMNIEAVVKILDELVKNPAQLKKLGENGRSTILEKLNWEIEFANFFSILSEKHKNLKH